MDKKSRNFLYEYLNNASPTSYEASGQKIWLDFIAGYTDEHQIDGYGSAYAVLHPENGKSDEFRVVVEAHADEISWYVNHISDEGFLSVVKNGGSDPIQAPSKRVNIHTRDGVVKGVFGWPAIHLRKTKNPVYPNTNNIFIDVGASKKSDVEKLGIHVGCVVTYEDELLELNNNYYCGRALDNRMGGFCIAELAKRLAKKKIKLPYSLYFVNSVQEEVGLRGAQMIAERIQPNAAIITDVTHDTSTPLISTKTHGDIKCGLGPTITYAPAVHNKLQDLVVEVANKEKIPFQREAASRSTGTDTDAFAYSNMGVPSVLLSLPLRYMHSTVEMAHTKDIENLIKLMEACLVKIEKGHNFKYF